MKNKILNILIALIFLAVFNACFFTLIDIYSKTRWICYAAVHVAYLLFFVSTQSIPKVKGGNVHGYPKIATAWSYLFVTLLVGIIIIAVNPDSTAWPLVIFVIITGMYLLIYALLMKAEEHSIAADREDARNLYFIRDCSEQLSEIMRQLAGANRKKLVEQAYDAVRNAQVTSIPEAAGVEQKILSKIAELSAALAASPGAEPAPLAGEIIALVRQRDSLIRMSR